ncbi:MAG: glycosyltransferase family 4 protein [Candidatus Tyrphobacter sp.]
MRIALDAQLGVGTATGIGEYVRGLVAALRDAGEDVIEVRDARIDPWRFDRRVLWDQVLLPRLAARSGAALLHCASGTVPLVRSMPIVVTVHDVAWMRVQRHARWYARRYFGEFSVARYRRAAAVLADSAFSRAELLAVSGGIDASRVHVVAPGVASDFARVRRKSDRQTILAVGTIEPRKNLAHLIRLLPRLPRARLVAVGPATPYRQTCAAAARELGVADRVEFRGYVSRGALLDLYATAAVAAVPSQYEGFGYAAAQALCAGLPCVVSDRASLPEVVGSDGTPLALEDIDGWARALESALEGEADAVAAASREECARRFSWSTCAAKVREIYRAVLGNSLVDR